MLKFVIKNENTFRYLRSVPVVRKVVVFHINHLQDIKDNDIYDDALCTISTSNNTMKTTMKNRFADLNDTVINFFNKNEKYSVHDVAVSSGVTSLELYRYLLDNEINFSLAISDKFSTYNTQGKYLFRVFDADFNPAFYYLCGIYFDSVLSWKFPISKYFFFILRKMKFKNDHNHKVTPIFDKKITELLRKGKIKSVNYDIFSTAICEKFSFVRCMNILNKAYFDDVHLLRGINNIFFSLKDGGVLQIGRTDDNGKNNVSFYRKAGDKLKFIEDFNNGSELNDLVEDFNNSSPTICFTATNNKRAALS